MLTGPNMGGKSTLLRSVAFAVLMAQIGCYVPCESLTMQPVDRIFTRLGGADDLISGRSTFFCEMEETQTILEYHTPQSLILMDELGRGTSTFDGQAIASSVLRHLLKTAKRLIFSTHYHTLQQELEEYAD